MALYDHYPHLSDGHEVRVGEALRQIVVCPLPGAVEMPYSPNANPEEVVCGHCELLERIEQHPDLEMPACHDEDEPDEDPPVAGGSPHGGVHTWDEIEPCKPRLRRIHWCGVWISVDEGVVGDLMEVDGRWQEAGGRDFYLVRQEDTGAYACRNSKGHSRAIAVDENWSDGPMVSKRSPCPGEAKRRRFVEVCFDPVGWGWGARWRRTCDSMHHSPLPNEGGHGFLYRTHAAPAPHDPDHPTPTLTDKDDGEVVRDAQRHLVEAGYDLPRFGADGDFGAETTAAVNRLKADRGWTQDGTIGPAVWDVLHRLDEEDEMALEEKLDEVLSLLRGKREGVDAANYGTGKDVLSLLIESVGGEFVDGQKQIRRELKATNARLDAIEAKLDG